LDEYVCMCTERGENAWTYVYLNEYVCMCTERGENAWAYVYLNEYVCMCVNTDEYSCMLVNMHHAFMHSEYACVGEYATCMYA
jgi:hypothetical protein